MNKRQIKKRNKKTSDRLISVDWSNGKDHSVKITYEISHGVIKVLNSEVLN